jgi:hypothetical protein
MQERFKRKRLAMSLPAALVTLPWHFSFRIPRGFLRWPGTFFLLFDFRSRGPFRSRYLADSGIPCHNQLTSAKRRLLEIFLLSGKHLPAGCTASKNLNGSHGREFAAQTFMVLVGGRQPHPVVLRVVHLIAQNEHNLVLYIDRQAAKHGMGPGGQRSDCIQHKFMRNGLALFRREAFAARHGEKLIGIRESAHDSFSAIRFVTKPIRRACPTERKIILYSFASPVSLAVP